MNCSSISARHHVLFTLCTGSFNSSIPTFPRKNSTSKAPGSCSCQLDQTNRVREFHIFREPCLCGGKTSLLVVSYSIRKQQCESIPTANSRWEVGVPSHHAQHDDQPGWKIEKQDVTFINRNLRKTTLTELNMKLLTSSFAPAAIFMKDESLDLACRTEFQ